MVLLGSLKVAFKKPSRRGENNIKMYFKQAVAAWTVFSWLRTGISSGLL
jgi:hypothetical protein